MEADLMWQPHNHCHSRTTMAQISLGLLASCHGKSNIFNASFSMQTPSATGFVKWT
jgi:hypothetical protein